jgi:TonB-linked SusC/RagA family outer membrane protein
MTRYQQLIIKPLLLCVLSTVGCFSFLIAQTPKPDSTVILTDTARKLPTDQTRDTLFRSGLLDSMLEANSGAYFINTQHKFSQKLNRLNVTDFNRQPFSSLQQLLKGQSAGLFVNEPSAEPGTESLLFLHGITAPLLNKRAAYDQQPAIYVDGIPLIVNNALSYTIQHYDFSTIGPATNLLSTISPENIASIEVLTDPATLAALGPLAVNGAIWVTTKRAESGYRKIFVNGYYGVVTHPQITPINASWENDFRRPFYEKYDLDGSQMISYPTYLKDSSDLNYYGPANWVDAYYSNQPIHSVDMSLTGGTPRANFRFMINNVRSAGVGDGTFLDRYGLNFAINMAPLKWFTVSAMVNAARLQRNRNKNVRDRMGETGYMTDLSHPLPPNRQVYEGTYLKYFDDSFDDNKTNSFNGFISATAKVSNLTLSSKLGFDYNEGIRDVFWANGLMEGNNYLSNYFSYNQRLIIENTASYDFHLPNNDLIAIDGGQSFTKDRYKYDYGYGYNTPNDFIKINKIDLDKIKNGESPYSGLNPYMFRFTDKQAMSLASLYGRIRFRTLRDALNLGVTLRYDGSSNYPADSRWMLGPVFSADYDFTKNQIKENSAFSTFDLHGSYGRIGRTLSQDRFAAGPQYIVDMGWGPESGVGSYRGMAGISRPYRTGWVGYSIPWAYSDKAALGLRMGWLKDRIVLSVDIYNREDKNQLLAVPAPASSGYAYQYESGLWVNNKGIDAAVNAIIIKNNDWQFSLRANANFNKNTLKALPNGASELIIDEQKLQVGASIDNFWLYENQGSFNGDGALTFNGVPFKQGDPLWKDENGDGDVNQKDKVLKGNYLPKISGGFGGHLGYKNVTLDFDFFYALDRKVLNRFVANRYDFAHSESASDINSVKEITYWQLPFNPADYPTYNPWSDVEPYREDQDLFLQDASFLKLRDLTIGYDFSKSKWFEQHGFHRAEIYISGTNLLTITPFKTGDPELTDYNGIYDGYGMPIPKIFSIGVKLDF